MHKRTAVCLVLALLAGMLAAPLAAQDAPKAKVQVEEFTLDNGMQFLVVERHDNPTVSSGWVAHVGSANETYGITGIAHLFEHMMFKGTTTIGTKNAERELEIMDRLDVIREKMEQEYSELRKAKRRGEISGSIYDPDNRTEKLQELAAEMKQLQDEQHELIVKDELDQIYTEQGASGMNAGTMQDMTVYFVTVPKNKLELWFWMESDRLANPVFREFYSERDVVREERRLRVESDPTAKYAEQFNALFWMSVPYHHPVIGWPADVESISREQANDFFATYYAPNNLTAAVVGDVDVAEVRKLAERYFSRIPRGEQPPPEIVTTEIEQLSPRRMKAEADTNPSVELRWHTVPFIHHDAYTLDIVSELLSGRTGRLYKALIEEPEQKLATGRPYAYSNAMRLAGSFEIGAELAEGRTHQEVESALLAEIDQLKNEPVGDRELQKVKNQVVANSYRKLQSNFFLMLQLLFYDGLGDWHYLNQAAEKLLAVTAEDVMAAAEAYFPAEGLNAMWYSRKAGTEEDPELAAVPDQARPMVKQTLSQIQLIEDVAKLQMIQSQMQAAIGQAPDEMRPAIELILKRLQERLDTLQADEEEK